MILQIYLIGINCLSLLLMGLDKLKALRNNYRISEKTLIFIALIGGAIGIILGMLIFHHKTQKILFKVGIPIIIMMQIILCITTS